MTTYELCEFYREVQVAGSKAWTETSVGEGFATLEDAVAFATHHLASRGADDRYPWVGVIQTAVEDGEPTGWAQGWVTPDGVFHEGDYENDPALWAKRTILIHLNVTVPYDRDDIGPDEVADAVLTSIEVASIDPRIGGVWGRWFEYGDLASGNDAPIQVALAEEV